jgi:hypothetical protein
METFVILALLLLLVAAVAPGLYVLRKRIASGGQVELWRAMQRRGLNPADAAEEPRNLAVALRRCTLCPSVETCHEWLASGAREGLEEFCPNAAYFKELEPLAGRAAR